MTKIAFLSVIALACMVESELVRADYYSNLDDSAAVFFGWDAKRNSSASPRPRRSAQPAYSDSEQVTSSRQQASDHRHGRCPSLESRIAAHAPGQVSCYSRLFAVEGGCSTTVKHNQRITRNPNKGIGLCALESDRRVRITNGRGPSCDRISSIDDQIKCCVHIMRTWGRAYFGTISTGKARKCG